MRSCFLLILLTSLPFSQSLADGQADHLWVQIRTIAASQMLDLSDPGNSVKRVRYHIDQGLGDLSYKLKRLHYAHFKLLTSHKKQVKFNQVERVKLDHGHTLVFKPLFKNKDRVCLWVRWNDNKGMELLDTQMHFNTGESMVTGMDAGEQQGLILAIDVPH